MFTFPCLHPNIEQCSNCSNLSLLNLLTSSSLDSVNFKAKDHVCEMLSLYNSQLRTFIAGKSVLFTKFTVTCTIPRPGPQASVVDRGLGRMD